jgi:CheY-like chemotaxis protein
MMAVEPRSPRAVLIADGDRDTRARYRAAFDRAAYAVHESEDGAEALGKAICHRPDLVVTETRLRRIDGFSLCQLLRDDPTTRDMAIIVVSSSANEIEMARARNVGADAVLGKPCAPETLLDAVQHLQPRNPAAVQPPVVAPPVLECPVCQSRLIYEQSHTGGVKSAPEQWDDFRCPRCGPYQYRRRTRKLKATT